MSDGEDKRLMTEERCIVMHKQFTELLDARLNEITHTIKDMSGTLKKHENHLNKMLTGNGEDSIYARLARAEENMVRLEDVPSKLELLTQSIDIKNQYEEKKSKFFRDCFMVALKWSMPIMAAGVIYMLAKAIGKI